MILPPMILAWKVITLLPLIKLGLMWMMHISNILLITDLPNIILKTILLDLVSNPSLPVILPEAMLNIPPLAITLKGGKADELERWGALIAFPGRKARVREGDLRGENKKSCANSRDRVRRTEKRMEKREYIIEYQLLSRDLCFTRDFNIPIFIFGGPKARNV
jgi:hypothetical protein